MENPIETKNMNIFERYLTLWVSLCIISGIVLGKIAPYAGTYLSQDQALVPDKFLNEK